MQTIYLSRKNLNTLLAKLDRVKQGEHSNRTIIKRDLKHKKYPCTDIVEVIAIEDEEYYTDRLPGATYKGE